MVLYYCSLILLCLATVRGFVPQTGTASRSLSRRYAKDGAGFGELDGSGTRIGIIKTRWNEDNVDNLVKGTRDALKECKVPDANIFETTVPGAYELPFAARLLALSGTVDAVICVGVLVKGDTSHFEYISEAVSQGIMNVGLQTNVPVIFGVLTCQTDEQVTKRSTGKNNHGIGWGKTAVEMALLRNAALGKLSQPRGMGFGQEFNKPANGEGMGEGGGKNFGF